MTLQFSGGGFRQRAAEFDGARIFVRRDRLLHELLQCLHELRRSFVSLVEHDECFDELTAGFIGHADHRTFFDRWVLEQR